MRQTRIEKERRRDRLAARSGWEASGRIEMRVGGRCKDIEGRWERGVGGR